MTPHTIFLIMCMLVPVDSHHAEHVYETIDRYWTIADTMSRVSKGDRELAAYLITAARYESTYDLAVHDGSVRGDDGRSWSIYQINTGRNPLAMVPTRGVYRYLAKHIVGTDYRSTARATLAAAVHMRWHIKHCGRNAPLCVFNRYGGVPKNAGAKTRERISQRVTTWKRIRR